jgi:hypothetical protein
MRGKNYLERSRKRQRFDLAVLPVSRFAGKWTTAGFLKLVRPVLSWDLNDAFFEA